MDLDLDLVVGGNERVHVLGEKKDGGERNKHGRDRVTGGENRWNGRSGELSVLPKI